MAEAAHGGGGEANTDAAVAARVRSGELNSMVGRDLARILALRALQPCVVYSISQVAGFDRAVTCLEANFGHRDFVTKFQQCYPGVHPDVVCLDYFWSPTGAWFDEHWKPLFNKYLLGWVDTGFLRDGSVVWLPCSISVLNCVLAQFLEQGPFSKRFDVQLVTDMEENILWKATQTIDPITMQDVFEKKLDQVIFGPAC